MKYLYIFFVVFFFQGCIFSTSTINKTNYKNRFIPKTKKAIPTLTQKDTSSLYSIQMQTVKKTRGINFAKTTYTGSIKGIIRKLTYDKSKKLWLYEIYAKDVSNAKLPYAKFYNPKKLANEGDFVYVILNNSTLRDLFFIKKTNKKTKKLRKIKKIKKYKKMNKGYKNRKKPKISVPTVENVTF